MPIAVIVERAGLFEDAVELHAARPHVFDVGLGGGVAVLEGAFFLGFAPEDFVIAIGVERRVNINQIDATIGQFGKLFEIVATVDDAGVHQRRRTGAKVGLGG